MVNGTGQTYVTTTGLLGHGADLLPLQILVLNLLTNVFPALALGVGEGSPRVMQHLLARSERPVMHPGDWQLALGRGLRHSDDGRLARYRLSGPPLAGAAADGRQYHPFFGLAAAQLGYVFNSTGPRTPLQHNDVLRNRYMWMALALWSEFVKITHYQLFMCHILGLSAITRNGLFLLLVPASIVLGLGRLLGQLLGCRSAVAQPVVAQIGQLGSSQEH